MKTVINEFICKNFGHNMEEIDRELFFERKNSETEWENIKIKSIGIKIYKIFYKCKRCEYRNMDYGT